MTLVWYDRGDGRWTAPAASGGEYVIQEAGRCFSVSYRDGRRITELGTATHWAAPACSTAWSTKRYLNIELLKDQQMRGAITA